MSSSHEIQAKTNADLDRSSADQEILDGLLPKIEARGPRKVNRKVRISIETRGNKGISSGDS